MCVSHRLLLTDLCEPLQLLLLHGFSLLILLKLHFHLHLHLQHVRYSHRETGEEQNRKGYLLYVTSDIHL